MVYDNKQYNTNFNIIIKTENKTIFTNKINDLYKYKVLKYNKINKKIVEVINNDVFLKIHLLCQKKTNVEDYNRRHNLLIIFDNLLKKFLKKKYDCELKNKDLCYTDISFNINNNYFISFYIVISEEFGVFKNMNNIFILMKEFNRNLKDYKNKMFGDKFINLNIYNKNIKDFIVSEHLFTYVNNNSKNISIYNEIVYNNEIFYKDYFIKNLISYSNVSSNLSPLDYNTNTLNNYFK